MNRTGFAWFAIPFGFATTLGLAAVALTDNPKFPTYPNPMTASQVSSGLSAPFGAAALLGKNGAIALLITLFMAVTSSSSSELIAVSSILTFDIYKTYVKPKATPEELIMVSHIMICVFAVVMAGFACIWQAVGIDLGWLFLVMGLIIGGAVFPAAFTITWKGQTKAGAISGCIVGLIAGIAAWLAEARVHFGELTVASTGASYPTLAGNMAALFTGLIVTVVISYIKPDNFDWEVTRAINVKSVPGTPAGEVIEGVPAHSETSSAFEKGIVDDEKKDLPTTSTTPPQPHPSSKQPPHTALPTVIHEDKEMAQDTAYLDNPKALRRAFVLAVISSVVLSFIMCFLIPIPMFLSHYIYSKGFFEFYVIVSFLWVFAALFICGILPVWETRVFWGELWGEVFGKGKKGEIGR